MPSLSRAPLAVAVIVGSALLTACGIGTSGTASPVTRPPATATPGAAHPTTAGAATRCTLADLQATIGRTTGEAGQRHTAVIWTNTSGRDCTMTGFGGVDLEGPDDPTFGPTYSLPRSSTAPSTVRLAPGATASTTITWLPPQDGPGWTPTQMLVTPPDETRSATLLWPEGAVLRQDGATHPGTFIDPVQPGAGG
ncbi:MAG: DUF4232 domain-containing protein [Pseudonocardia sp.]